MRKTLFSRVVLGITVVSGLIGATPTHAIDAGFYVVTNTADSGPGSLRAAVNYANSFSGAEVRFNIPTPPGVQALISLRTPLPCFRRTVFVRGLTQPGSQPNTQTIGDDRFTGVAIGAHYSRQFNYLLCLDSTAVGSIIEGLEFVLVTTSNVRFGNVQSAIFVAAPNSTIRGNTIGKTTIGPTGDRRVFVSGIQVQPYTSHVSIGGPDPADRNIVAAHHSITAGGTHHVFENNYLCVDGSFNAIPFCNDGIGDLTGTGSSPVGRGLQGAIIRANVIFPGRFALGAEAGIYLYSPYSYGNAIDENWIGVTPSFVPAPKLAEYGIGISLGSPGNTITRNFIYFQYTGIRLHSTPGNELSQNSIAYSTALAIDLRQFTGTPAAIGNDYQDVDTGANDQQNYPELQYGFVGSWAYATLNSLPNETFRIEWFASSTCHVSEHGPAERYLGEDLVETDANGDVALVSFAPSNALPGEVLTATATHLTTGNTSELSRCLYLME